MKFKRIILFILAVLTVGCARKEMVPDEVEGGILLNIDGSIDQIQTRVSESGFEDGDALGLYAVNWTENNTDAGTLVASGNQADNAKYTYDGSAMKWTTVRPVYYKDANTHADLYVYYPYQQNVSDVEAYPFEVAKDQTTVRSDGILGGYEASDLLWCKVEDVTPTESKVMVRMQHRMAGAQVFLVEGTGFEAEEFDSVSKSVILLNTTRKATVNFQTGTVTPVGDPQADGIVMCPQADGDWRAVVVPQTISNVYLFAITIGGQTYRYRQGSNPIAYTAGHVRGFAVTINKISPSGDYTFDVVDAGITAWTEDGRTHAGEARQYYVVNVETPGTLGATLTAAGKNPDRIRNLKVTGTVNTADFYFMRDNMAILEAVNMKECQVENNTIPNRAFNNKKTLLYFVFPDTVEIIDDYAFTQSSLSGALVLPSSLITVGEFCFSTTNITSVSFPDGLKEIKRNAFGNNRSLVGTLYLPHSLEIIRSSAFKDCNNLSGPLHLPDNLKVLEGGAFYRAGSFSGGLEIPSGITSLGATTFYCSPFSGTLTLNNCTSFGDYCFQGCQFQGELVLPEGVVDIPNVCFSGNRFSSVKFPSTLRTIGDSALNGNLYSELIIPEGVTTIGAYAFSENLHLSSIELPSTLQTIQAAAFSNCYGVSGIISHATIPPTVQNQAFQGIGKDNFTVEVPENSLVSYQTETGWNDFKRFAAYQSFSISRRLGRALNAETSRTYILRCESGMTWSIASKPDWITVTPSSGMGKTEVTVTFAAMPRTDETFEREEWNGTQFISSGTYKGRAGEVVFQLDAKGNTNAIRVEQFDYDYKDGSVLTKQTHTRGSGIQIVLTGDGYDALDIATGKMLDDMDEGYGHFFDLEPYATYKDYFDVYYVFAESDESGIGTLNAVKDTRFGSYIGENRMVAPDDEKVFEYALKPAAVTTTENLLVILIDNTTIYEGMTYLWGDGSAIACCPKSSLAYPYDFRGIVQHEAGGHGFGKLADEYIYHNAFISTCLCQDGCDHGEVFNTMKARGWFRNLEFTGNMNDVAWSHLIFNPDYSDKVDIYEGGYMHNRGVFRSEATSCMNNNIPYYSAISRQAMVERILTLSGEGFTMQKFYDNDSFRVGAVSRFGRRSLTQDELHADFHYSDEHGPVYMGEHPILK